MKYKYELHCHTREGSACGALAVEDLLAYYRDTGYAGICITDHFTGNSSLPAETSWAERVEHWSDIYETAHAKAAGLAIFPAMEFSLVRNPANFHHVTGNDFLILGLTKEWLLANERAFNAKSAETFARIREVGGFIIHAHPFLEAEWIEYIRLLPRSVDAVEVYNAHVSEEYNHHAAQYARSYGLLETAGSDAHNRDYTLCGVETDTP